MIILVFSMGEGFVLNNLKPGWGLDQPNPFQLPQAATADIRYPPIYDLLSPRRTCYADRPGGYQIMRMGEMNPQSSREQLTQVSTNVVATKPQISKFIANGKVDLTKLSVKLIEEQP